VLVFASAGVVADRAEAATSSLVFGAPQQQCPVNISVLVREGESARVSVDANCAVTVTHGKDVDPFRSLRTGGKAGNPALAASTFRRCTSTNSYDYNIGPTVQSRLYTYMDFYFDGSQVTAVSSFTTSTYTYYGSGLQYQGGGAEYRDTFTPDWDVRAQDDAVWNYASGWHHTSDNNAYGYGDGGCHTWFNHYGVVCGLCSVNFYVDAS